MDFADLTGLIEIEDRLDIDRNEHDLHHTTNHHMRVIIFEGWRLPLPFNLCLLEVLSELLLPSERAVSLTVKLNVFTDEVEYVIRLLLEAKAEVLLHQFDVFGSQARVVPHG